MYFGVLNNLNSSFPQVRYHFWLNAFDPGVDTKLGLAQEASATALRMIVIVIEIRRAG